MIWTKCQFTPGMLYYELDEFMNGVPFDDKDEFNGVHADEIWEDLRGLVWFLYKLNIIKAYDYETEIIYMRDK